MYPLTVQLYSTVAIRPPRARGAAGAAAGGARALHSGLNYSNARTDFTVTSEVTVAAGSMRGRSVLNKHKTIAVHSSINKAIMQQRGETHLSPSP